MIRPMHRAAHDISDAPNVKLAVYVKTRHDGGRIELEISDSAGARPHPSCRIH